MLIYFLCCLDSKKLEDFYDHYFTTVAPSSVPFAVLKSLLSELRGDVLRKWIKMRSSQLSSNDEGGLAEDSDEVLSSEEAALRYYRETDTFVEFLSQLEKAGASGIYQKALASSQYCYGIKLKLLNV